MDKRAGMGGWPTAWARCKGNVIDEPTAPQNLELGQIDLAIKEEFCHRWPQGGEAHRGQAHEVRSARPPAAMPTARGNARYCATFQGGQRDAFVLRDKKR